MPAPAEVLEGLDLPGGWHVTQRVPPKPGATGGRFSVGYLVEGPDGRHGFLKALDYSAAFGADDRPSALKALTEAYVFERDLLRKCREHNMDRVVVAVDDGSVGIPGWGIFGFVDYIVFERADGDVRSQVDQSKRYDLAFALRSLHSVATGLTQLHRRGVAHQDLKPSNVLIFSAGVSKVSDLGTASYLGHTAPVDGYCIPGDPTYAPPELLYGHMLPSWSARRFGCDAYLMGSMIGFFFTGAGLTSLLIALLPRSFLWDRWPGTYGQVLPYLRDAFDRAIEEISPSIPEPIRGQLIPAIRQLCEPDPLLRGHPLDRRVPTNQYSLERYISLFNRLAREAEYGLIHK